MKFLIKTDINFAFQTKDDNTITLLMSDENVDEVTEFITSPDEKWYIPFKVGKFISKEIPKHSLGIENCVRVIYERHPDQTGAIMKSQNMEAQKAINKGAGRMIKKRKI